MSTYVRIYTFSLFSVPRPVVQVTSVDTLEFGDVATLECSAIAVRGITSRVDIIWTAGFRTVRRVEGITASIVNNSAIYTDQLVTPPLNGNDNGRVYQCQVVINADFRINAFGSIVLDFFGKYVMIHYAYVHMHICSHTCYIWMYGWTIFYE